MKPKKSGMSLPFATCGTCKAYLPYPSAKQFKGDGNRIVGRADDGGHICRDCFEGQNG